MKLKRAKYHFKFFCCDTSCDPSNCNKRHPKECKYCKSDKKCKFNLCMFLHTVSEQDDKFKELGDKVNKIEDNLND